MFGFLFKKNFCDIWDNFFHFFIVNLIDLVLVLSFGFLFFFFSKTPLVAPNYRVFLPLLAIALGIWSTGDYVEAVAVMLFYQIGEWFQSYAVGKSRRNISALMDIRPDYANLIGEDGQTKEVDPDEVEIGSMILVQPGEKVPIDGIITEGDTSVDTSALTGESVPRTLQWWSCRPSRSG